MNRNNFSRIIPVYALLLLFFSLMFQAGTGLAAEGITAMLRFPELNIHAGENVTLKAYFHNESNKQIDFKVPDNLPLRLHSVDGPSVLLTAVEDKIPREVTLLSGGFVIGEYKVSLPLHIQGTFEISLINVPGTELLVNLTGEKPVSAQAPAQAKTDANDDYPSLESLHSLYQPYVVNFSLYEPLYFLAGTDLSESKFQISFRYRPLNPAGTLAQKYPWLSGVNFAFTQTSFWDLASDSAPFEDTSYKPEVFYLTRNWETGPGLMKGLFFQGGVRHESNGRGGDFSRSTNTIYFKPIFIFYDADSELGFQFSPKLFAYFNNSEGDNPDLDDYRGNVDFELKFGKATGIVSTTHLRVAKKGISFQTDLSYPISKLLKRNLDLFFHVQYSNSLAESLINYKERTHALRLGISIVR